MKLQTALTAVFICTLMGCSDAEKTPEIPNPSAPDVSPKPIKEESPDDRNLGETSSGNDPAKVVSNEAEWKEGWSNFVNELANILETSETPPDSELTTSIRDTLVLTGNSGEKRWVLDFSAPPGTLQGNLNKKFGNGVVKWQLTVEKVTTTEESIDVAFEKPRIPNTPSFYDDITVLSANSERPTKVDLKEGDRVIVAGKIIPPSTDNRDYSGVTCMYGVGENSGQHRIAIFLSDAEFQKADDSSAP